MNAWRRMVEVVAIFLFGGIMGLMLCILGVGLIAIPYDLYANYIQGRTGQAPLPVFEVPWETVYLMWIPFVVSGIVGVVFRRRLGLRLFNENGKMNPEDLRSIIGILSFAAFSIFMTAFLVWFGYMGGAAYFTKPLSSQDIICRDYATVHQISSANALDPDNGKNGMREFIEMS